MLRRSRRSPLAVLALMLLSALAVGVAGCGSSPGAETGGRLTVSAASSLKAAFTEIGRAFDAATGSTTTFNFDASGALQKQIEAGAPVDVFAAAATTQVNALLKERLLEADSVRNFASNEIVLVVPAGSSLGLTGFEDLAKPEVEKVAYGDPVAAPHGVYAEQVLEALGVFDRVRPKVVFTKNTSQTLTYVISGEVDAGLMFSTDARAGGEKVETVAISAASWHDEIVYPLAVVSDSRAKDLARAFVDFVTGPEGRSILQKYGFVKAPSPVGSGR